MTSRSRKVLWEGERLKIVTTRMRRVKTLYMLKDCCRLIHVIGLQSTVPCENLCELLQSTFAGGVSGLLQLECISPLFKPRIGKIIIFLKRQ